MTSPTPTDTAPGEIVERLRDWPAVARGKDALAAGFVSGLMVEAATLIEQQAATIAELREIADDRRYSNEYLGNLVRSKLAVLGSKGA